MKSSHDKYFLQEPPSLKDYNRFEVDYTLKNVLSRLIPQDVLTEIGKDLSVFSERINREIEPLHYAANQSHKYPILQTYDGNLQLFSRNAIIMLISIVHRLGKKNRQNSCMRRME